LLKNYGDKTFVQIPVESKDVVDSFATLAKQLLKNI